MIPAAYISKATSRVVDTGEDTKVFGGGKDVSNQGYGYFWWNGDLKVGDKSYFSTSAQGGSGQFIILVEELDLIIVATGAHRGSGGKNLQIAAERILPAFIQNSISTMNLKNHSQDTLSAPIGPYIGQKPPGLSPEIFASGIVSTENHEWGVGFTPDMK
jgi:CubicO group peptidase (beta-lactamase class C family)